MCTAFSLLQKSIIASLKDEGIYKASSVQENAIPRIVLGKNLLVIAPTGVGKTYTSILPIFSIYLSERRKKNVKPISIIYITPLRALNRDIHRRVILLGQKLGIKVDIRHGDTSQYVRSLQAKNPPDMLITTPETLQAILPGIRMKEHLKNVRWVVIDEIHELASDKRGVQLTLALERLRNVTNRDFQRIGLSATVGSLLEVGRFLAGTGRPFEIVRSPEIKNTDISIEFIKFTAEDVSTAKLLGITSSNVARARRIIDLIASHTSTLVFTNTREHAEALGSLLYALDKNLPVRVHHGSLSKEIRETVEKSYQNREVKAIVCTSSLELGIDVGSVDLVIQYMSPRQATKLIQRVGRSGHALKKRSKGVIIAGWTDDILESTVLTERLEKGDLENTPIYSKPYDVMAHQVVGIILDFRGQTIKKIYNTVKQAYPYRDLLEEELLDVLRILEYSNVIRVEGDLIRPRSPRAYKYYYENLSVIPDVKRYTVYDFISKKRIGTLDQEFVARRCATDVDIIMYGYTWRIIRVEDEQFRVDVESTTPSLDAIPTWEGEMIPVEYSTALRVGKLRQQIIEEENKKDSPSPVFMYLSHEAVNKVSNTIREHSNSYPLPTSNHLLIERFENIIVVHSCLGTRANETLALVLSTLITSEHGISIRYQVDPYRIALTTPYKIEGEIIKKILKTTPVDSLPEIIENAVENSNQFAWRYWHIAKRFGIVERKADYSLNKVRMLRKIFKDTSVTFEARKETYTAQLDIQSLIKFLTSLQKEEITISIIDEKKEESCTPLSTPILDKIVPHDLLRPIHYTGSLIEIVKERINNSLLKLICIHKGDWENIKIVKSLSASIRCPHCQSNLIAVTYPSDRDLKNIIKKRIARKKLSTEEKNKWRHAWKSASLVQIYGNKAIIVMAGRGIGPTIAARLLRKPLQGENELYGEILKAERLYARTRVFWD